MRRLVICLGLGALAPLGTVSTGSLAGAAVVGVVLAAVCWMVWGMLDADEHQGSSSDDERVPPEHSSGLPSVQLGHQDEALRAASGKSASTRVHGSLRNAKMRR